MVAPRRPDCVGLAPPKQGPFCCTLTELSLLCRPAGAGDSPMRYFFARLSDSPRRDRLPAAPPAAFADASVPGRQSSARLPQPKNSKNLNKISCGCPRAFESVSISKLGGVPRSAMPVSERGPQAEICFFSAAQAGFLPRAGAHASKATGRRGALTADPFFQCDAGHTRISDNLA
jgi:hypothetical protein